MTHWALACSETLAFLMPKFLGYFAGLSLQTELLMINLLGLLNSTLDWSYLRWEHQVEEIWSLPLLQQNCSAEKDAVYWIKSILSWIVIARIIVAHQYTFSYVANMYSILTWSRPRYLIPWIALSFFKNVVLEIVVLVLCSILWFEKKISTHLMVEFAIVKGVSLSLAFYNWFITVHCFLEMRRAERNRLIRKFTLSQGYTLSDKTGRLSRSFDENYHLSVLRKSCHASMPNLEEFFYSTSPEGEVDARFSMSLTTLLTNASWISEDEDLSPKEKCMKALELTEEDVSKARKTIREPLSFLSLQIFDQISITLERDPEEDKDLIYFLVHDCDQAMEGQLETEKRNLVMINEEEYEINRAAMKIEETEVVPFKAEVTKYETDDIDIDVPTSDVERQKFDDRVVNVKTDAEEKDTNMNLLKDDKRIIPPEVNQPTKSDAHPCSPFTKKMEKRTCDVMQSGGKCLLDEAINASKANNVTKNSTEAKKLLKHEIVSCQCPSLQDDTKVKEESLKRKSKTQNGCKTSDTVAIANENFQSLLQAFKKLDGKERLPEKNIATNEKRNFEDAPGDNCSPILLEPLVPENTTFNEIMQEQNVALSPIPLRIGFASRPLYSELPYRKIPNYSIAACRWFHDRNPFTSRHHEDPLKIMIERCEQMSLKNLHVYNTVQRIGTCNRKTLKVHADSEQSETNEFPKNNEIVQCLAKDTEIAVHRLQSVRPADRNDPASTSTNVEIVDQVGPPYLRSRGTQTESRDCLDVMEPSKSAIKTSDTRRENASAQTNISHLWKLSRNKAHDIAETMKEVEAREGKRYREDEMNNGGTSIVSRNSVRNFHRANRIHSQSTSKPAGYSSQSCLNTRADCANAGYTGSTIVRNNLCRASTPSSSPHEGSWRKIDSKHSRNLDKTRADSFGTVSLAQVAHRSGYHRSTLQMKPPVYPKKCLHEQASRSIIPFSDDLRVQENAMAHALSFGRRIPGSVRENRHVDRQYAYGSQWLKSRRNVESAEDSEARHIRALKAYNKFTLLEDKREMDAKKREIIVTSKKAKARFSNTRDAETRDFKVTKENEQVRNKSDVEVRTGEDSPKDTRAQLIPENEIKPFSQNRSILEGRSSCNYLASKNPDKILLDLNSRDAGVILELLDCYGGKRLKEELKKIRETSAVDSRKQYTNCSKPKKDIEDQDQPTVSYQKIEDAQKGLERIQAKQDDKEDTDALSIVNNSQRHIIDRVDETNIDTIKTFAKHMQDSPSPISTNLASHDDSLIIQNIDNSEESTQNSITKPKNIIAPRTESPKSEEAPNFTDIKRTLEDTLNFVCEKKAKTIEIEEKKTEIVPSTSWNISHPSSLTSARQDSGPVLLENKVDTTINLESQSYQRIVVVESESTNSMESLHSDGETWVLEERLDERLFENTFYFGNRLNGLDFRPPRIVTNSQMQGGSVNVNDLRKSTQAHIVDDMTAGLLHNAFYFKSEIVVRTIRDASSFDSESRTDSEDAHSRLDQMFTIHRLGARTDDFICYTSSSDVNDFGYQRVGHQQSSEDAGGESSFNLCLILDREDLSDATEQSSTTLIEETVDRHAERENGLQNVFSCRFSIQFMEPLQERREDDLRVAELSEVEESGGHVKIKCQEEFENNDNSYSNGETVRRRIRNEFPLADEERILCNLKFPIACDMFDMIPSLEDYVKKNWQIQPFTQTSNAPLCTPNTESVSKNVLCEILHTTETDMTNANESSKIFENALSSDNSFPHVGINSPSLTLNQTETRSSSSSKAETTEKENGIGLITDKKHVNKEPLLISKNSKAGMKMDKKGKNVKRKTSPNSQKGEIQRNSNKILEPRPSKPCSLPNSDITTTLNEPELLPLSVIFAFCQLIILLYIQFFFSVIFPNEKASKSTITMNPYEVHSVCTSTTKIIDPPSVDNHLRQKSSLRQTIKISSNKSMSSISEDINSSTDEKLVNVFEPLNTTEQFPKILASNDAIHLCNDTKVMTREIRSNTSFDANRVVEHEEQFPKSSSTDTRTVNTERRSSAAFEHQKSFYFLDADTHKTLTSSHIVNVGNHLPKLKLKKKSETGPNVQQDRIRSSGTAVNMELINESPGVDENGTQNEEQPINVDVTSSAFQCTDSFDSTFTKVNETSQSVSLIGEHSLMEDFSEDISVASASGSTNEEPGNES